MCYCRERRQVWLINKSNVDLFEIKFRVHNGDVVMMKFVRKFKDLGIQGKKAHEYDEFSRKYRLKDLKEYANLATSHITNGGSVLEVATGPGYFCTELAKLGNFKITGLDISNDLVKIARTNAQQAGVKVDISYREMHPASNFRTWPSILSSAHGQSRISWSR